MATTKKSSKKTANEGGANNGYPVELTKGYIAAQIAASVDYAAQALCTIADGQTRTERSAKNGTPSLERNGQGFMSSHAVRGMALAAKIQGGEKLSTEEKAEVQAMAARYTKQLARHARDNAPASVKKQIAGFFTDGSGNEEKPVRKTRTRKSPAKATTAARTSRARKAKKAA